MNICMYVFNKECECWQVGKEKNLEPFKDTDQPFMASRKKDLKPLF
jgi:hypothetical protein